MSDDLSVTEIWVSEHYWPGAASELVTAQAQRLVRASGAVAAVVLAGEQTAFGIHVSRGSDDVRRALAAIGLGTASVGAGWLLGRRDRDPGSSGQATYTAGRADCPP